MKKDDVFEFPGDREAGIIGTATRTRRAWKRNGNIGTIEKELGAHRRKVRCPQDDYYLLTIWSRLLTQFGSCRLSFKL